MRFVPRWLSFFLHRVPLTVLLAALAIPAIAQPPEFQFAIIGDYGWAGPNEQAVADLVKSWVPACIITTGDNNYDYGAASTIDQNIGQYYHEYIAPYTGSYGAGAAMNAFYPCLGNHDWVASGAAPYLNYFTLPGNERYYDVALGPVQFFFIDSDPHEPDGTTTGTTQAEWLHAKLTASSARFKFVVFHHPPYCSGTTHGSTTGMRWPFAAWGATAVLNGHEHIYERLSVDGVTYIVNGLGGRSLYPLGAALPESQARYNARYGAIRARASIDSVVMEFVATTGDVIDRVVFPYHPTGVEGTDARTPSRVALHGSFPNPAATETMFTYVVPERTAVSLMLYDALGRAVRTLVNGQVAAGEHTVSCSLGDLPAGMYVARLTTSVGVSQCTLEVVR